MNIPFPFAGFITIFLALKSVLVPISTVLSMLFLAGVVYLSIRLIELSQEEEKEIKGQFELVNRGPFVRASKWERVHEYLLSSNPSDWKVAILEADALLEEAVTELGIPGESLGDQLKNANPGTLPSLEAAWQAHKWRNEIAHGREVPLSRSEAERIIKLYESALRSVQYI